MANTAEHGKRWRIGSRSQMDKTSNLSVDALAKELARSVKRQGRSSTPTRGTKKPVPAGKLGPVLELDLKRAQKLFLRALLLAASSGGAEDGDVLWNDGDDQLLLHIKDARLVTDDSVVVVGLPVYSDQSGETELAIPFVTEDEANALGFNAATESVPRGHAAVIDRFGDSLVAIAWMAIVETVTAWAAAAGERVTGAELLAAGLSVTSKGFVIPTQAPITEARKVGK